MDIALYQPLVTWDFLQNRQQVAHLVTRIVPIQKRRAMIIIDMSCDQVKANDILILRDTERKYRLIIEWQPRLVDEQRVHELFNSTTDSNLQLSLSSQDATMVVLKEAIAECNGAGTESHSATMTLDLPFPVKAESSP